MKGPEDNDLGRVMGVRGCTGKDMETQEALEKQWDLNFWPGYQSKTEKQQTTQGQIISKYNFHNLGCLSLLLQTLQRV